MWKRNVHMKAPQGLDRCYYIVFNTSKYSPELVSEPEPPIRVRCVGLGCVDSTIAGNYGSLEELPIWLQRKLSVLVMVKVTRTPTRLVQPAWIKNVGKRVDENTFWVEEDIKEGDTDG